MAREVVPITAEGDHEHMTEPLIIELDGAVPDIDAGVWIACTATVIGSVRLNESASVWYGAVLRADSDAIAIGAGSNIQDGVAVHVDPGFPVSVGRGVSVGHNAVLHGCTIGDDVLVGMGAVVLNGAVVGDGSLVAAGALVPAGVVVPPRSLVAGLPAKVRRELSDTEAAANVANAAEYRRLARVHDGGRRIDYRQSARVVG
jgi:carbonic anhydrase/acetyltransferase-like protein (isoleucine patch superfamily)